MPVILTTTISENPSGSVDVDIKCNSVATQKEAALTKVLVEATLHATKWMSEKFGGTPIIKSVVEIEPFDERRN